MEETETTLKEARERAGITQLEASEKIDVSITVLSKWEGGKITPKPAAFKKACEVYGVSPFDVAIPGKTDTKPLTLEGARYAAGLTQRDVGRAVIRDPVQIGYYENGKMKIPEDVLEKMLDLYGVTRDQVVIPGMYKEQIALEDEEKTINAYEYGVGAVAPEHLPEDQHITELQQAQDRIKFLEERLSFYEESEEVVMMQIKTIGELKADLEARDKRIALLERENRQLERQNIELKAEAYDLMKEKSNLFKEFFELYQEKEDSE